MALHAKSRASACPARVLDAHILARFKVFIGPFCGCTKVTGAGSGRGSLITKHGGTLLQMSELNRYFFT